MIFELGTRKIRIPDNEIEKLEKAFELSKDEAVKMWLEDEGIIENAEQIALDKKAKNEKITQTIHSARADSKKKTQRERVKKQDLTKENIISELATALKEIAENVEIVNAGKIITFTIGEENFKLDLIRQRKPKEIN